MVVAMAVPLVLPQADLQQKQQSRAHMLMHIAGLFRALLSIFPSSGTGSTSQLFSRSHKVEMREVLTARVTEVGVVVGMVVPVEEKATREDMVVEWEEMATEAEVTTEEATAMEKRRGYTSPSIDVPPARLPGNPLISS